MGINGIRKKHGRQLSNIQCTKWNWWCIGRYYVYTYSVTCVWHWYLSHYPMEKLVQLDKIWGDEIKCTYVHLLIMSQVSLLNEPSVTNNAKCGIFAKMANKKMFLKQNILAIQPKWGSCWGTSHRHTSYQEWKSFHILPWRKLLKISSLKTTHLSKCKLYKTSPYNTTTSSQYGKYLKSVL